MKGIDLTGQRFGNLNVLGLYNGCEKSPNNELQWACQCKCGNIKIVRGSYLRSGKAKSCGYCGKKVEKNHLGGRNYEIQSMPSEYCRKYGCHICAETHECVKIFNKFGYVACKYANILEPYGSYANYERAAKMNIRKVVSKFPKD